MDSPEHCSLCFLWLPVSFGLRTFLSTALEMWQWRRRPPGSGRNARQTWCQDCLAVSVQGDELLIYSHTKHFSERGLERVQVVWGLLFVPRQQIAKKGPSEGCIESAWS